MRNRGDQWLESHGGMIDEFENLLVELEVCDRPYYKDTDQYGTRIARWKLPNGDKMSVIRVPYAIELAFQHKNNWRAIPGQQDNVYPSSTAEGAIEFVKAYLNAYKEKK